MAVKLTVITKQQTKLKRQRIFEETFSQKKKRRAARFIPIKPLLPIKPQNVMQSNDDGYDPYEYRNVPNPSTNWQAMANFLKASIGTGVLAMPVAFLSAGYVNAVILTLVLGIICIYCLQILFRSMYMVCKRKHVPYLTYSEAMKIGFEEGPPSLRCLAPIAMPFCDGFLAFFQFGVCCVYVVFVAESVKQIVDVYYAVWDLRIHIWLLLIPVLLIFSIRTMEILAYFSTLANVLLIFGFAFILYFIFIDLPPLSDRKAAVGIEEWPVLFGIVLFSIITVGVFLSIEETMKTPKSFLTPFGILNMGMLIIIVLYIIVGFFGYWKYGNKVMGSITLNIPQDEILSQVIKMIFAFTIWITYSLSGYVSIDIIWAKYLSKHVEDTSKHVFYERILRIVFVFFSIVCACLFPDLGLFLSVIGAFCLSFLGIICPAVLQICIQYSTGYGPLKILLIKNILIVIFGFCGGAMGIYVALRKIMY